MNTKKLAYGFLILCVAVTGYLLYDTFRIASNSSSGDEGDTADAIQLDPGEISIDFNDYEIEEKTTASLLETLEDSKVLYLYENEQVCGEGAFDYSNENLLAVIKFSGVPGEYVIENVSVFKRTIEGTSTEISSIPTTSFELNTEDTETGLKGDLKFVWDERVIEGEFDAASCVI
ncbi:hypothetical protein JW978_02735 [Candidatus Dojkabacteria bacterium]|nr:hypothetical protein [Candidatus Dojkabacteria bacterium]